METSFVAMSYLIYLPVVIILTWYVARTLFKNGKIFMVDIFHGKIELATSTNKLFELGFYLLNVGFALLIMETSRTMSNSQDLLEALSKKLGGYSIYLGVMLFFNLMLFFRGKKTARRRESQQKWTEQWQEQQLKIQQQNLTSPGNEHQPK